MAKQAETNTTETEVAVEVIGNLSDKEIADFIRDFTATTTIAKTETFTIPMVEFPLVALGSFLAHGAQRKFNDAVGGKDKSVAEKVETVEKMIDEFKLGIVGKRRGGGSVDELTRLARQSARRALRVKMAAVGKAFKTFTALSAEEKNAILDMIIAEDESHTDWAKTQIEVNKKASASVDLSAFGL